jgi:hypothetical protein
MLTDDHIDRDNMRHQYGLASEACASLAIGQGH